MPGKLANNNYRERIFKVVLYAGDIIKKLANLLKYVSLLIFSLAAIFFFLLFIYYIGFVHTGETAIRLTHIFRTTLLILFVTRLIIGLLSLERKKYLSLLLRTGILIFSLLILISNSGMVGTDVRFWRFFNGNGMVIVASFMLAVVEVARMFDFISSLKIPPALIFSTSFLTISLIGSGLLMLPNSHTVPIKYIDALFTSVSSVCVTGLSVVNIAGSFTLMGQIIIMCLIQIGGLGMMTFTGFFSFIFTSRATFQERMLLQDIFSSESLGNLFQILIQIVLFTFIAEGIGALVIYMSLDNEIAGKVFVSIFHSVSAFCNAGISILPESLISPGINNNYLLLSAIMLLIIIGGLGFPVILKIFAVLKSKVIIFTDSVRGVGSHTRRERFDAGSKIVVRTTLFLLFFGALVFFLLERNTSLKNDNTTHRFFISFFNSVTSRTAGFNISDLSVTGYPAVFLLIFLMWVGASPGSTGGGIKTSTFSIALRNAWGTIRGRKTLEIANREINPGTINRVLSIIILSLIVIGTGFFFLMISEPQKNPVHLIFETVSAYSTVGLSLADTSTMNQHSKSILIMLMFIGRVGPLTFLTGLFFSGKKRYYKLTAGDIIIN
jgi:potassium uptake TrkH family protein